MTDHLEAYREKMGELERARREVEKVRKDAIDQLLAQRAEITKQLRQLGYEGEAEPRRPRDARPDASSPPGAGNAPFAAGPTENRNVNGGRRRTFKGARTFENAFCAICQLKGHDLRAHKGQEHKRAFSAAELRSKGLPTE